MLAFWVGLGNSVVEFNVAGIGRVSINGLVGGLTTPKSHDTGSATWDVGVGPPSIGRGSWKANAFLDVSMIGPITAAAPAAPAPLSMSLRVMLELSFLVFFRFFGILGSPLGVVEPQTSGTVPKAAPQSFEPGNVVSPHPGRDIAATCFRNVRGCS